MQRCEWAGKSSHEWDYHDREWGVPLHDDRLLFEFLVLEGAQAGLSWSTILKKRDGYRRAFDNFVVDKVARYSDARIAELLANPEIVRNWLKVNSAVLNAQKVLELQVEFGSFDSYIWQFVGGAPVRNSRLQMADLPATTEQAHAMSADLKRRGFKFIGPTICYAFMQATGMVNDHVVDCLRYGEINAMGR